MLNSIRWQLTVIICFLIFVAIVSTLTISYSLLSADYEAKMQHNNAVIAESLAANIAEVMHNAYTINQFIAEYPELENLDAGQQAGLLAETVNRYPIFQVLAIHTLTGEQTARSSGVLGNRAERWWFKKFINEQQPYISTTYYSVVSESPITTIVHGIYTNGALVGLLMADIEIKKLQQMVENYNFGADSYAYLLDGEGTVIAHPDRQQVAELYNYQAMKKKVLVRDNSGRIITDEKNNELIEESGFPVPASLQAIVGKAMAGETGSAKYQDLTGEEYICAYRAIVLPGKSKPWSLLVVQKKSAAMAFMGQVMMKTTSVGILVIIFAALLTMWFSRRITNPLIDIVTATNWIKAGNLSVELTPKSSNEVGVLAANFNQMVYELRQHREKLEELVKHRTTELAAVNHELKTANEMLAAANQRLYEENKGRQQTEEHLLTRERQYRAITGLLTGPADETEDILENILHNAIQLLNAVSGFISLLADDGKSFCIHYGSGIHAAMFQEVCPAERGMHGHVCQTGEMFYVADYRVYPHRVEDPRLANISSVIMMPLKQNGKVAGILSLSWVDDVHVLSKEDLAGLCQFGDLAAVALARNRNEKRISHMAYYDALTGLPNRASLQQYLDVELQQAHQGESQGIILFIDLDDLKAVNDNFGHSFGDKIIAAASRRIVAVLEDKSFIARIGGDEFIVVVPGRNSRGWAAQLTDKLLGELAKEYQVAGQRLQISASIGVVVYPDDGDMVEDILKKADSAMYAAKQAGRNCWRFYEPILLQAAYEKMMLTNGLRRGLEQGEFFLEYQPQFTADGSRVVGFEALLRWKDAVHGLVSPAKFIPAAEQNGLILPIGQWVFQQACLFAKRLSAMNMDGVRVAVNLSPRQLLSDEFVAQVREGIVQAGIQPAQLEFEITESVFIEAMEDSVAKLEQLRDIGVTLALDDFGTGYSSLTYLRNLPVSVLKIDKSFIDNVSEDKAQLQLVGSIINLGHNLGLSIVAEGVEQQEQLMVLTDFGCDCVQGYIFSKPLPEEKAIMLLQQKNELN